MAKENKTDLSFALGLAIRNMGLNPAELNDEQIEQLQFLAADALLEQPKTKEGKKLKFDMIKEKANSNGSEYVKQFSFGKDLHENKVKPMTVFLAKLVAESIDSYLENGSEANDVLVDEMSGKLIAKLNDLGYPIDYLDNFFKGLGSFVNQVNNNVKGQSDARKDQITALAIGVRHPTYDKLDSRIVTFRQMDESIERLRKDYNFTEDDYRS